MMSLLIAKLSSLDGEVRKERMERREAEKEGEEATPVMRKVRSH